MPDALVPKLQQIKVRYDRLLLDPNNPRFTTKQEDRIPEEHYLDKAIEGHARSNLLPKKGDPYKIAELVNSIKTNGWLAVDYIFVTKLKEKDKYYIVLEGNRRVTAIQEIMDGKSAEVDAALKEQLNMIDVMEVLDSGTPQELQKKITYLLGVRHHGSLKKWTPFAQAHNIFIRYLEVAKQTPETFKWLPASGQIVADTLSIPLKEVQDRLKIYRVMVQVGSLPEVKNSENGGMKDRYYSVCGEPILSPRKKLGEYIKQDASTFLLLDDGPSRMNTLCQFGEDNRGGVKAPIDNRTEWQYLDKILTDEDKSKSKKNLEDVVGNKRHPSEVWAERAMELSTLTWEKWLFQVSSILKTVSLGDDFSSDNAKSTAQRLVTLLCDLDKRDLHSEGK